MTLGCKRATQICGHVQTSLPILRVRVSIDLEREDQTGRWRHPPQDTHIHSESERHRERPRVTERDPEKYRKKQRCIERLRLTQKHTESDRDRAEGDAERGAQKSRQSLPPPPQYIGAPVCRCG